MPGPHIDRSSRHYAVGNVQLVIPRFSSQLLLYRVPLKGSDQTDDIEVRWLGAKIPDKMWTYLAYFSNEFYSCMLLLASYKIDGVALRSRPSHCDSSRCGGQC